MAPSIKRRPVGRKANLRRKIISVLYLQENMDKNQNIRKLVITDKRNFYQ
jgi:hypothetical protein